MQITTPSQGMSLTPQAQTKADLEQAAKQFEAIFMRQMISAMRSASLDEGLGDSSATLQFRDMADARIADSMAERGGLGVAQVLVQQLGAKLAPAVDPAAVAPETGKMAK